MLNPSGVTGDGDHRRHTRFAAIRARMEAFEPRPGWPSRLYEFLLFGFKQGWACLFGALMLALLLATHLFYPEDAPLHRYDFITLAAIAIQIGMLVLKLETLEEAKVIFAFHIVGTVMELFKTSAGSWIYPGEAILRIGDVPLFSGFMYGAVGSFIARIWRIFGFRFTCFPNRWAALALAVAIYVNFFAHHWLPDVRIALFVVMGVLFWPTWVHYTPWREERRMPLLLGWLLVALFIWFAENISTFARAWTYPSQESGWEMVSPMKLGAWYLLMYISFILVHALHGREAPPTPKPGD
jgi:uncharacterized membrane protein YoaT (DUF817 family)